MSASRAAKASEARLYIYMSTIIIDIHEKSQNLLIFKTLMLNNDVIAVMSYHFLKRVTSYVKNINIHILLKFQPSIT